MPDYPYHQSLRLQNFTVFKDATFEFVPGINVLIGPNGSGKTHVMKAMYAYQYVLSNAYLFVNIQSEQNREVAEFEISQSIANEYYDCYQVNSLIELNRNQKYGGPLFEIYGKYDEKTWNIKLHADNGRLVIKANLSIEKMQTPVFIPALDMINHSKGFLAAYNQIYLDFDSTCKSITSLLISSSPYSPTNSELKKVLSKCIGGEILRDEDNRFYISSDKHKIGMPMVANGVARLATLVRLYDNGWLMPGATLYWDEPELSLNPANIEYLVTVLILLARMGVQIIISSHSYVLIKELDLQSTKSDLIRFISLKYTNKCTDITMADNLSSITFNPILDHYGVMYDREIEKDMNGE